MFVTFYVDTKIVINLENLFINKIGQLFPFSLHVKPIPLGNTVAGLVLYGNAHVFSRRLDTANLLKLFGVYPFFF